MAKLPMKKIEIIASISDTKSVLMLLQRRGVVDFHMYDISNCKGAVGRFEAEGQVQLYERYIKTVNEAISLIDGIVPHKESMLKAFEPRTELDESLFMEREERAEVALREALDLLDMKKRADVLKKKIEQKAKDAELIKQWLDLGISTRFRGTTRTTAFIGTLPRFISKETLVKDLNEAGIKCFEAQVIYSYNEQTGIFILCHKSEEEACFKALSEMNFARAPDFGEHDPLTEEKFLKAKIEKLSSELEDLRAKMKDKSQYRDQWVFLTDYFIIQRERYDTLLRLAVTKSTVIMEGYIPERAADKTAEELNDKFDAICVNIHTPAADEDVPVAFDNKMPVSALEDITASYSMPSKRDVDPTGPMAAFYYAFFGLMLSDAGYGLLMTIATALILKFKKPEGNMRRNMQKFMLCGISTTIWGFVFGSFFGNIIETISLNYIGTQAGLPVLWFDPVKEPMKLLYFSIICGFIQILAGLGVKFYALWKRGRRIDAIFDVGMWYLVFAGIAVIAAGMLIGGDFPFTAVGIVIASAGGIGLVLTQGRSSKKITGKIIRGLASLYDITTYFSDILSYTRLMALGLVTMIIASVVNDIGAMGGSSVTGVIMFIIVFLIGHSINFAINALGAYVHCNRLQYVEFFSKFYEGGGREFKPFALNTKHYKIREEG